MSSEKNEKDDRLIGWFSHKQAEACRQADACRQENASATGCAVYSTPEGGEALVTEARHESDGPSEWPDATRIGVIVSFLRIA